MHGGGQYTEGGFIRYQNACGRSNSIEILIIDGGGAEEGQKILGAVIGDAVGSRFEIH